MSAEGMEDTFQLNGNLVVELSIPERSFTTADASSSYRIYLSISPYYARSSSFTFHLSLQQSFEFPLETTAYAPFVLKVIDENSRKEIGQWNTQIGRVVHNKWVNKYHKIAFTPARLDEDSPIEYNPILEMDVRTSWSGNSISYDDFILSDGSLPPLAADSEDDRTMSDSEDEYTGNGEQDTSNKTSMSDSPEITLSPDVQKLLIEYDTPKPVLPKSDLIDRRLPSSTEPPPIDSMLQFSLVNGTGSFSFHSERHISTALSASTEGNPIAHSSSRYGVLYDDTHFFDDRNFLLSCPANPRVTVVRVWSREYIHGIQTVYGYPDGNSIEALRNMGKVHTTMHKIRVDAASGEFIIGIEGTYREWIETLTIITNRRKKTFGGNVENRPSKYVMLPSSKDPSKPLHSFSFMAPHGHKILGFHGGYGMHIHNLGVWHAPIFDADHGKVAVWTKIKDKIKRTWSRDSLNDLVARGV